MKKLKLFGILCNFRVASYYIQDLYLLKDDLIVSMEEQWLNYFGYDYEEYQNWKSLGEEISNADELIVGGK